MVVLSCLEKLLAYVASFFFSSRVSFMHGTCTHQDK